MKTTQHIHGPCAAIFSIWKCRGLWYHKVWGLLNGSVLDIAPHRKGYRSKEKAEAFAAASIQFLIGKFSILRDAPVIRENSPEWEQITRITGACIIPPVDQCKAPLAKAKGEA